MFSKWHRFDLDYLFQCIAQNKHREALDRALLAKEMLINFPKEVSKMNSFQYIHVSG